MVALKICAGASALIAAAGLAAAPLAALSVRQCNAAYKQAQRSGTLGAMSWQEFRKARCAARAKPATGPAPSGSAYLPGGRAIFPTAVPPRYSDLAPTRARRQTCLDQYRLNKASDANGGLKWVQEGGGYFSECTRRLRAGSKR